MTVSAARHRRRMSHAALGLGLFALFAGAMIANTDRSRAAGLGQLLPANSAYLQPGAVAPAPLFVFGTGGEAVEGLTAAGIAAPATGDRLVTTLTLAAALAALGVFNIGLLRHLRRVYASPRRGRWRRS